MSIKIADGDEPELQKFYRFLQPDSLFIPTMEFIIYSTVICLTGLTFASSFLGTVI